MKILLLYFTGTYNTAFISQMIADQFIEAGHEAVLFSIESKTEKPKLGDFDLIGLGYPIHAFNEPKIFRQFVRQLPLTPQQKVFIYKDSGEVYRYNDASSRYTKGILKKKKVLLMGEYHFVMPYNIIFRTPDAFVKESLIEDEKAVAVMIHNLRKGIVRIKKPRLVDTALSLLCLVEHSCGYWNSFFMKVDKKKCLKCYQCLATCPQGNIVLKNGRIRFGHRCLTCMRCAYFCPTDAIKMGFLNSWKVNGAYRFQEIKNNPEIPAKLDRAKAKKFYRSFTEYFEKIDEEYDAIAQKGL